MFCPALLDLGWRITNEETMALDASRPARRLWLLGVVVPVRMAVGDAMTEEELRKLFVLSPLSALRALQDENTRLEKQNEMYLRVAADAIEERDRIRGERKDGGDK